ncbi:MAG TPA: Crp/Fnr family transcriptional regulator [Hyphomonadaceae bacterium]|nr:Crp/Fnr family transcriptional regulator [Hyphomonadaceae bacterium]
MLYSIAATRPLGRPGHGTAVTRRLGALAPLSADDFTLLAALKGHTVPAGTVHTADSACLILSGWAARVSVWPAEQPQIMALLLPGDSFGLCAPAWAGDDLPVTLLTDAVLLDATPVRSLADAGSIRHAALIEATAKASCREQHRILDNLVRLGRCGADQRVAHLALELYNRLDEVGLVDRMQFQLPLRQQILAEALGLNGVHFNRITRRLKHDGIADFTRGAVRILDAAKLATLAGIK